MAERIQLAVKNELEAGQMKRVQIPEGEVLLARVGDNFYATQNKCPHMGGNLSKGKLEGTIVTCPVHGSQYDLKDGKVIRWTNFTGTIAKLAKIFKSPRPLKTYRVDIENDRVFIES